MSSRSWGRINAELSHGIDEHEPISAILSNTIFR